MVFENIGTLFSQFNFLGMGIYIIVLAGVYAVALGISRDKEQIMLNFILLGTFGTIVLFAGFGEVGSALWITTAWVIFIAVMTYLKENPFKGLGKIIKGEKKE